MLILGPTLISENLKCEKKKVKLGIEENNFVG
jgi:hypothetical protein